MESCYRNQPAGAEYVRRVRMAIVALALLCFPLAAAATSDAAVGATVTVNNGLTPKILTIQVGTAVTWQLADTGKHRIRSLSGPVSFDSGGLAAGGSYSFTFGTLGTVNYGDAENANVDAYLGSINVVANVPLPTTPPPTTPPPTTPPGGPPPAPSTIAVRIANRAFAPASISIVVGDTVVWTNADQEAHTVTDRGLAFDSGSFGTGATFRRTFASVGNFTYICDIHPSMVGVVAVSAPSSTGTLPPPPPPPVPVTAPPGASGPGANSISMFDFGFSPALVTVAQGTTITWSNTGLARHTVAANDGSFHSPDVRSGQTYARTFTTPGTYAYICDIHPDMKGTVAVTGPGGTPPPPASAGPVPVTARGDITIADFSFSPRAVTVRAGQSLTFVNAGVARHTATSSDGSWDTGTMIRGASVRRTFPTPGTYLYFCTIHPNMKATIFVTGANGEAPPPPKSRPVATVAAGDVSIVDFAFSPETLTVAAGASVGFVNNGVAPHTATSNDGSWDTGIVRAGTAMKIQFATPGTFSFYCTIHPQMKGTILVTGADGSAPPPEAAAAPSGAPSSVAVKVLAQSFEPANARIAQGGTVTWTIESRSPHRITADDQSFDSTLISHGTSFLFRFDRPGTYSYHDGLTGDRSGTITVVADSATLQAGSAPNGTAAAINIIDSDFSPGEVIVTKGATVTWTNTGHAPHTVTAKDRGWTSDLLKSGDTFAHTFGSVGRFAYVCNLHPNMVGTVVVTDTNGVASALQSPQAAGALVDPGRSGRGSTSAVLLVLGGSVVGLVAFVIGRRTAGAAARA